MNSMINVITTRYEDDTRYVYRIYEVFGGYAIILKLKMNHQSYDGNVIMVDSELNKIPYKFMELMSMLNDISPIYDADSAIKHSGIKGMHWGERRWQYEDGTYTPAGRIHYGIGDGEEGSTNVEGSTTASKIETNLWTLYNKPNPTEMEQLGVSTSTVSQVSTGDYK